MRAAPIRHCAWTKEGDLGTERASGIKMKAMGVIASADTSKRMPELEKIMALPRD